MVHSARANVASSLVNGFVHAGFGHDITNDGEKWMCKNKGYDMMASLGLVLLWDVRKVSTQMDKFLYSTEDNIKMNVCVCEASLFIPFFLPSLEHSWLVE